MCVLVGSSSAAADNPYGIGRAVLANGARSATICEQ